MSEKEKIVLAVKCAPKENILKNIRESGINAVELYLSKEILKDINHVINLCKKFPLRYAIHAPGDGSSIEKLKELSRSIKAEVIVFHNVYWEDEWNGIIEGLKGHEAHLAVENTYSTHEPIKFMRRYGLKRCLDLEHLQMECAGVFEEIFISVIKEASHIHLTGYVHGSELWHTHIHHSPEHGTYMLGLLEKAGYSGFVVSEAKETFQTKDEFKKLKDFYDTWEKSGKYHNTFR